jgi:hypothetical protein
MSIGTLFWNVVILSWYKKNPGQGCSVTYPSRFIGSKARTQTPLWVYNIPLHHSQIKTIFSFGRNPCIHSIPQNSQSLLIIWKAHPTYKAAPPLHGFLLTAACLSRGPLSSPCSTCVIKTTCRILPYFCTEFWGVKHVRNKKRKMKSALQVNELMQSTEHLAASRASQMPVALKCH